MGVCVEQRVDDHDLTITSTEVQQVGQILNDAARRKLLIVFTQCLSGTTKQTACFREFDLVTQTFGSVVQIEADTNIQSKYYLHAALLLDGTIVVAYSLGGPGTGWRVRESTDHGLNWTTTMDFEPGGVEEAVGFAARDNTLWMFSLNGSSAQDLYKRTRVSGNNWNAKELIFDGSASESWAFSQNAAQMAVLFADGTACVVGGRITGFSQTAVKALYYNGFNWIESLIQSYGDTQDREPIVIEGASNRLWVMFINRISLVDHLQVAYSDNAGTTWTFLGEPAGVVTPLPWDPNYSRAFAVDEVRNNAYASTFDTSNNHRVFKGNATPPWADYDQCGPVVDTSNNEVLPGESVGHGLFVNGDFYRLYTKQQGSGPAHYELWLLKHPSLGEVPPPVVSPGISTNRIYRRGTIQAVRLDDGSYAAAGIAEFPAAPNFGD